jgi:hypothetical protein
LDIIRLELLNQKHKQEQENEKAPGRKRNEHANQKPDSLAAFTVQFCPYRNGTRMLWSFIFSGGSQAPPDGVYANFTTAEEQNALFSLSSGAAKAFAKEIELHGYGF